MQKMTRVGAVLRPDHSPEALRDAGVVAEDAGVDEVWLWEDCFKESALSMATAILSRTTRVRVGIGLSPMPLRNVCLMAMEIATIDRLFPGRLIPTMGHGVPAWMKQAGANVASPLTLMREYIPALRELLTGAEVTTNGRYVHLDHVRLDWPPEHPVPIFGAGDGKKTIELTGEVADGTLVTAGRGPDHVAELAALARTGRARSGRGGDQPIVNYLMAVFGHDAEPRAAEAMQRLDLPADEHMAATGAPSDIADRVREFAEVGSGAVILTPFTNEPVNDFLTGVGEVARLCR